MAPKEENYLDVAYQRMKEKKTHASFPQLKYPSLRDEGMKDPVQWLTGKAMDDGAEGLWRVHNGIYDLRDFMKNHPGGSEWLELSKGTDITEAFETHHFGGHINKILDKFYVREANTPRNSPFTFKDDGFYRTLKRAVIEEMKKIPKDAVKSSSNIIDGLFMTCLLASALSVWAHDFYVVNAAYLTAAVSLCWTVVASHNYIHFKPNWRMYLWNISMWSYRDFRVSHALSHHLYTNTLMDMEISTFEPLVWWNPTPDKTNEKFTLLIECAVFPFLFLMNFGKRFLLNFTRKGFFTDHYKWHDLLGFALPVWMYCFSHLLGGDASFLRVVYYWLWILCTGSFFFFQIGSNAAHHHPKIFKDGNQVRDENPDWGMHELEAVMDRKDINSSLFTTMTFFGNHALHHLFPTLDHAYLPYLYPVFLENCQKFRANFRETSSLDLFIGQLKMSVKKAPNVLKGDEYYASPSD